MARVRNVAAVQRSVAIQLQRAYHMKTTRYREFIWQQFLRILENTPQFSGMAVANWNIGIGAPDTSYDRSVGDSINYKEYDSVRKKGDREWIEYAIARNRPILEQIKPGDKVYITNSIRSYKVRKGDAQYYMADLQTNWRKRLRDVNRPYEVAAESAAIVARDFRYGQWNKMPKFYAGAYTKQGFE